MFGEVMFFPFRWGWDDCLAVEAPIGVPCSHCEKPIQIGELGLMIMHHEAGFHGYRPVHRLCFLDAIGANPDAPVCPKCGTQHAPHEDHED